MTAREVLDEATVLAQMFSDHRRSGAALATGPDRAFRTDLRTITVPYPLPGAAMLTAREMTCGVALQASPSKEAVAGLPISRLSRWERRALVLVEGAAAREWTGRRWPGLRRHLDELLPDLPPVSAEADGASLLEQAVALARQKPYAPSLLGELTGGLRTGSLPGPAGSSDSWRLPWSHRRPLSRRRISSIPVGGSGGGTDQPVMRPGAAEGGEDSRDTPRMGIPYDEWDASCGRYRKLFVNVVESDAGAPRAAPAHIPTEVAAWFRGSPGRTWARRRPDGVDVDVDAFVAELCARRAGGETAGQVYADLLPSRPDIATALLLDTTGSLSAGGGRFMKLQLQCADAFIGAAVEAGERCAAFAFSGSTRHQVAVRVLKNFDDPGPVTPSAARLVPGGYTRLGAAVRHVTARLVDARAERQVLLAVGDGIPCDEGYEGPYAFLDVAKAVDEATAAGVVFFYVAVGGTRHDLLAELLGPGQLRRISRLSDLPVALGSIYQRLRSA